MAKRNVNNSSEIANSFMDITVTATKNSAYCHFLREPISAVSLNAIIRSLHLPQTSESLLFKCILLRPLSFTSFHWACI